VGDVVRQLGLILDYEDTHTSIVPS
jgi:hypothetical protein